MWGRFGISGATPALQHPSANKISRQSRDNWRALAQTKHELLP